MLVLVLVPVLMSVLVLVLVLILMLLLAQVASVGTSASSGVLLLVTSHQANYVSIMYGSSWVTVKAK